jgi:hypothetical protein
LSTKPFAHFADGGDFSHFLVDIMCSHALQKSSYLHPILFLKALLQKCSNLTRHFMQSVGTKCAASKELKTILACCQRYRPGPGSTNEKASIEHAGLLGFIFQAAFRQKCALSAFSLQHMLSSSIYAGMTCWA